MTYEAELRTWPGRTRRDRLAPRPRPYALSSRRLEVLIRRFAPELVALAVLALGVVAFVVSDDEARRSTSAGHFLVFWIGFLAGLLAIVLVGVRRGTSPARGRLLLGGLGIFTYMPKVLLSPSRPLYFDEFGHYRQLTDMISSGHFFVSDTYLPIMRVYPGLEWLTWLVHDATRLSPWSSALVVVGVAHCASLFVIYALARELWLSPRAAFIAAVVFSLNPSFLYFDTEYSYESLGIVLAFTAILCCLKARRACRTREAVLWAVAGAGAALACTLTHHVSSWFMLIACIGIALIVPAGALEPSQRRSGMLAAWAVAATAATCVGVWLGVVAQATIPYVLPHIADGLSELTRVVTGHASSHTPGGVVVTVAHTPFAGSGVPWYERDAALASPFLVLIAVGAGGWRLWSQRKSGQLRLMLPFLILALVYFASLPLALTSDGGEPAHRSWAFSYLGVALLIGYALDAWRAWGGVAGGKARYHALHRRVSAPARLIRRTTAVAGVAVLAIVCVGNVATGEGVDYRFPGPYTFGTDTWSMSPELTSLTRWMNTHLPSGSHVVTDRFTGEAVEGFTHLNVPTPAQSAVYRIYQQGDDPTRSLADALLRWDFTYFVLDERVENKLPQQPFFEGYTDATSVTPAALLAMRDNAFVTLIHKTQHYEVFELNPGPFAT